MSEKTDVIVRGPNSARVIIRVLPSALPSGYRCEVCDAPTRTRVIFTEPRTPEAVVWLCHDHTLMAIWSVENDSGTLLGAGPDHA